jgi:hypothetical protein
MEDFLAALFGIVLFLYILGSVFAFTFGAFNYKWHNNCDIDTGGKVIFYPAYKIGCFITAPINWNKGE